MAQIEVADQPIADWLRLARHMIKVVEFVRDFSAEEIAAALNEPSRIAIPTLDEL